MPLNIVCVLRSGAEYQIKHVMDLAEGVRRNLSLPYSFFCLTDQVKEVEAAGIKAIALPQKWPGWFAKICLFAPDLFDGPCWYADLDTIITGPLDDIVLGHRFTVLQNFWAEQFNDPNRIGSGLMAWNTDLSAIYKAFAASPERFIHTFKTKEHWGDQAFIKEHTPIAMERWQAKYPGKVVSFKKHVLPNKSVPAGAAVVCFHGRPRPWELQPHEQAWFDKLKEAA